MFIYIYIEREREREEHLYVQNAFRRLCIVLHAKYKCAIHVHISEWGDLTGYFVPERIGMGPGWLGKIPGESMGNPWGILFFLGLLMASTSGLQEILEALFSITARTCSWTMHAYVGDLLPRSRSFAVHACWLPCKLHLSDLTINYIWYKFTYPIRSPHSDSLKISQGLYRNILALYISPTGGPGHCCNSKQNLA